MREASSGIIGPLVRSAARSVVSRRRCRLANRSFVPFRGEHDARAGAAADGCTFRSAFLAADDRPDRGTSAGADADLRGILTFRGIGQLRDRFGLHVVARAADVHRGESEHESRAPFHAACAVGCRDDA